MRRAVVVTALVVAWAAFVSTGCDGPKPTVSAFTLLQANVGNTFLPCQDGYIFKLCEKDVEDAIKANIARLEPDVIAFQEILPDGACDSIVEDDPRFVCHPDNVGDDPSQIHRLLGDDYEYVCDDRNGYECVAAKKDRFALGRYLLLPAVDREPDFDEDCDPGFTVGTIFVQFDDESFTLGNAHPQSGFLGQCRNRQVEQIFRASGQTVLLSGDWNLDPFAAGEDPSVDTWIENVGLVGENKPLHYLSGPAEHRPPYNTTENALFSGVLDHVVSDVIEGGCVVLGESPGTERLDGQEGGNGCDHRALSCELNMPARTHLQE